MTKFTLKEHVCLTKNNNRHKLMVLFCYLNLNVRKVFCVLLIGRTIHQSDYTVNVCLANFSRFEGVAI